MFSCLVLLEVTDLARGLVFLDFSCYVIRLYNRSAGNLPVPQNQLATQPEATRDM